MFRDCAEDTPMPPWDTLPLEQRPAEATQQQWVGQPGERPAENKTAEAAESCIGDLHDPRRWGLSADALSTVGERLYEFWLRFRDCFKTRTRDTSANAYNYLRGQLTMDNERNFANMAPGPDRRRRTSPAALYVQLAVGGPSSLWPDSCRDQGDGGIGPGEHADSG